MPRKRKRRSAVVEIGTGPTKVRIFTINRKDGYLRCPNDPLKATHGMLTSMRDAGEISEQVCSSRLAEAVIREFFNSSETSFSHKKQNRRSEKQGVT